MNIGLEIGNQVIDREDNNPDIAYVVALPEKTATEWIAYSDTTIADDNPDYPEDSPIVVVVFERVIEKCLPDWDYRSEISLDEIDSSFYYAFPAPRLDLADQETDSGDEEDTGIEVANTEEPETPTPELLELQEQLADYNLDIELADDQESLVVEKLGVTYHLRPNQVEGDGPHRDQLEEIVLS